MKQRLNIFIIIFLIFNMEWLLFPLTNPRGPDPKFDHLSIKEGLSQSSATSIFQDSRGFMWFGTQNSLNKYDGNRFTLYRHDINKQNSLSNNFIMSICETGDGILWIVSIKTGLNRFNPKTESFTRFKEEKSQVTGQTISSNDNTAILPDKDNTLWIGNRNCRLDKYDPKTKTFTYYLLQRKVWRLIPGLNCHWINP
jgi:ligand-binding sensor domain-containing protein